MNMNPNPNDTPWLFNMIQYEDELLNTFSNQNSTEPTEIYGLTLGFNAKLFGLKINGDFNITRGINHGENSSPIAHIPPNFGKIEILKELKDFSIKFRYLHSGKKAANNFDTAGIDNLDETPVVGTNENGEELYGGLPSWSTMDFSIKYNFSEKIGFQINIENILDIHYKTFGSGLSAPGRNFIFSTNILL